MDSTAITQAPDEDAPLGGHQFVQFAAGCFWGVELAFQRVHGVTKTEVGYSQGILDNPTYTDVCSGNTNHAEIVRVQYDPNQCGFESLLDLFGRATIPLRSIGRVSSILMSELVEAGVSMMVLSSEYKGGDTGTQYRSGIYFYTPEQEKVAWESLERHQEVLGRQIVTEILPAKKFYRAEEYHQQYLAKGGRHGSKQSSEKGCNDPIRCYG